jgi:hypothetical protein
MALSQENQEWVQTQIRDAISSALKDVKPPSGIRKALFLLREWGVLTVVVSVILTLAIFAATQWNSANTQLANEASFRTHTDDRLTGIERQLIDIRALVASSQPNRIQNQDAAKTLLAEARQNIIPAVPAITVEQTGKSFIDASISDSKAWSVALDFAAYRSSLNASDQPTFARGDALIPEDTDHTLMMPPGDQPSRLPSLYIFQRWPTI